MGHLSFSYTSTVAPGADVSARYDFNAYSYESDLAVGVEWAPLGRGEMVKFGVGKEVWSETLSVSIKSHRVRLPSTGNSFNISKSTPKGRRVFRSDGGMGGKGSSGRWG